MDLKELIISAAHTAKDIPVNLVPVDEDAFNALNPRYTYAVYKNWVNEVNTALLWKLPSSLIKIISKDGSTDNVVNGIASLPENFLRPVRITLQPAGGNLIGARRRTSGYMLGVEQNSLYMGTIEYPTYFYIYHGVGGLSNRQIRFAPANVNGTATFQYIRYRMLTNAYDEPDIHEDFHQLIADMAAYKKLIADKDETAKDIKDTIDERIADAIKGNEELDETFLLPSDK